MSHRTWLAVFASVAACKNDADEPGHQDPPYVAPPLEYLDATERVGLGTQNGAQIVAVDLDLDGYADLVMSDNGGIDDFAGGPRYHAVLMNVASDDGGRTFVDATEESGLFQRRAGKGGRPSIDHIFADVDGDGDPDAFAGVFNDPHTAPEAQFTDASEIMLNDGTGHFTFAPASPALQASLPLSGASWLDFDHDGNLDLFVALWYVNADIYGDGTWLNWVFGANDLLLEGNGDGTFTDVTASAGLERNELTSWTNGNLNDVLAGGHARPSMGATACDLDGDGWPEILSMAYGRTWNEQWSNRGDGTFVEVGRESGYAGDDEIDFTDDWYYQCWALVNGEIDAPTTKDFPFSTAQCASLAGNWSPGWSDQPANLNGNTFATACADVDNDGDLDLLNGEITHEWAGRSSDLSGLLLNDGTGSFERPDLASMGLARTPVPNPDAYDSWDFGDQKAHLADLDNDGWKDVIIPSGAAYFGNFLYIWKQTAPLQFDEVESDIGVDVPTAHGFALADFDRDGDLDFVASSLSELVEGTDIEHRVYYFENTTPAGNHFVRIDLESDGTNSFGVGARVEVEADGLTQVQEVVAGFGQHGQQHERTLTFGLAGAKKIESIVVRWPDGTVDTVDGVDRDTQVLIHEGGDVEEE
jgi:enediyne biosynthesis protein E4